jgi:hypothetical protein
LYVLVEVVCKLHAPVKDLVRQTAGRGQLEHDRMGALYSWVSQVKLDAVDTLINSFHHACEEDDRCSCWGYGIYMNI